MDHTSPFQHWINANMKGIIASPDIMLLIAKAFEGGRLHEQEECAKLFDGAVWAYDYRHIAEAIRARKF